LTETAEKQIVRRPEPGFWVAACLSGVFSVDSFFKLNATARRIETAPALPLENLLVGEILISDGGLFSNRLRPGEALLVTTGVEEGLLAE
jgi:hypothetical protein